MQVNITIIPDDKIIILFQNTNKEGNRAETRSSQSKNHRIRYLYTSRHTLTKIRKHISNINNNTHLFQNKAVTRPGHQHKAEMGRYRKRKT